MKLSSCLPYAFSLLAVLTSAPAWSHSASTAFLEIDITDTEVSAHLDIALRDLEEAIGLDANEDGQLTWGEVRLAQTRIAGYALSRLQLHSGADACPLALRHLQIAEHLDGRYASLFLGGHCAGSPTRLRYDLLFDLDTLHRGLLRLDIDGQSSSDVFTPQRREIELGAASAMTVFRSYLHEGIWHVWTGWDHLLFLAALFLPAATRRTRSGWQVASDLRTPLWESARIVTAFTIAHAATLSLAALGWVQWPTRWVESAVAATVVFAALNNLLPLVAVRWLPWLAIFFGLIHGSAIAGALLELGLPTTGRVWALLAFNLGVEFAQLALVIVVVPLGFLLRESRLYRWGLLLPGSLLVMAIGLIWFFDRLLGWSLLSQLQSIVG